MGRHVAVLLHGLIHYDYIPCWVLRLDNGADEMLQVAESFRVCVTVAIYYQRGFALARSCTRLASYSVSREYRADKQKQQALACRPSREHCRPANAQAQMARAQAILGQRCRFVWKRSVAQRCCPLLSRQQIYQRQYGEDTTSQMHRWRERVW